jgi:multisubunit Na+/H+ antiporter MnhC subunit
MTMLAVGLREVSFNEARSFSRIESDNPEPLPQGLLNSIVDTSFWKQVFAWTLLLLIVVFIGFLLSAELRRRLIKLFLRMSLTFLAIYILLNRNRELFAPQDSEPVKGGASALSVLATTPLPEFVPPRVFSLTSYLVSFGVAVLLVILVWRLVVHWRSQNSSNSGLSLSEIAGIARDSLRELSSGMNSSDLIMRCYFRMSDVAAKRNLNRKTAMTPREFALRLVQAGLPADAVRNLTRLFETVRYGRAKLGSTETGEAVACLTTILHHCGETV